MLPIALFLTTTVHAACLPGTEDIGDTGPDSNTVCQNLESHYPRADIRIVNRTINQADQVSVLIEVDALPQQVEYRLSDFRRNLSDADLLATQQ